MIIYSFSQRLPGLRLIPLGIKVDRYYWPHWLGDYIFSKISAETLPLLYVYFIQYGRALERLPREIVFTDTKLGPVYMLKADLYNRFYQIVLRLANTPELVLVFIGTHGGEYMLSIPLNLPMGWKNSPPLFCTAT